jgi:hypothetical protein
MKETWKNLLKVKSIITITTTLVFCALLICSIFIPTVVIPQEFMMIYTTIIAFYFGTQYQKGVEVNETPKEN